MMSGQRTNLGVKKMSMRCKVPWLLICLGLLTGWGSCQEDRLAGLEKSIRDQIDGQTAVYGIAFRMADEDEALFINADDRMHAASTMKVPVMMRLFEMIDQGELNLGTQVKVRNSFRSIVDGSEYSITVDSEETLYEKLGKSLSLEALVLAMITQSSNLATNLLVELAHPEDIMTLMARFGAENMQVLRGVEDLKAYEAGRNNESSARDMLKAIMAAVSADHFSESSRQKMLEILRQQEFNDMIPAGLPPGSGALVAHKTGAISRVQHDAAIVDLPDGTRYGLVIFARDFGEQRAKVKMTARVISRLVYNHVVAR